MVSIKMDKCSSPRPETLKQSVESVSSTRILTLVSTSLNRRSRKLRDVTNLPSWPAKGLSLTMKFIEMVGSSILTNGKGSTQDGSQIVSPMFTSVLPVSQRNSPSDEPTP